ncbi:SPRY-domain-containing protein, partial [Rhizodiscina lignyota]
NSNQPSGSGPGFRRTSYASVAAGTAGPTSSSTFQQHGRSVSHTMNPSATGSSYPPPSHLSRQPSRGMGMDMDHNATSSSWGGRNSMPGYSSSFSYGTSMGNSGPLGGLGVPELQIPPFFVPSYLKGSRYAEKLEEAHKARVAAIRDPPRNRSPHSSTPGSLSTSASSANIHKMVPSHRGMTHDIIERAPPLFVEEPPPPLPTRWSDIDKHKGADVRGDGLEVAFAGAGVKTPHNGNNEEASAVRADSPMPRQAGIYYFECQVLSKNKDVWIGIGFCGPKTPLERLPGWEQESWALHGDDGHIFSSHSTGKIYGNNTNLRYGALDVIGCGVNFRTGQAFFTKNGIHLGTAFNNIRSERLFPCVGMKRPGEMVRANFGQTPFVFDIDSLVQRERLAIEEEVRKTSVSTISPAPMSENSLIQKLVAQYLAMDGYVETARAFAAEVRTESKALSNGGVPSPPIADLEPEEDQHAVNRQRIRAAILQGDIDHALKLMEHKYPSVLKENENIDFKLKCRKYVEMIRKLDEARHRHTSNSNRFASSAINGAERMDMDSRPMTSNGNVDDSTESKTYAELLQDMLKYGQELNQEFKDDPRREVKKALEETFALIAYAEPHAGPLAGLLDESGRVPVAEELNGAILVSLGKASSSGLERLVQQTEVLVEELSGDGGVGAFVNV